MPSLARDVCLRRSDFDDSVGYWFVQPTGPEKCRVYYSCDTKLRGWVPSSRLLEAWTGVARTPLRAVHVCGGGKRWNDSLTRLQLRTCGVDRLREPVVSFGVLERFGVLGWLAHAPLSPPARARYVGLMRFGEAPAYGALFERLFQLRMPFAASRALQALAASTVVLGVHARHRSQRDDGPAEGPNATKRTRRRKEDSACSRDSVQGKDDAPLA